MYTYNVVKYTVNLAKGSLRYIYLHVTIAKAPNVYYIIIYTVNLAMSC